VSGRRDYPDEPGSQWYSGQQGYQDGAWDRRSEDTWYDDGPVTERTHGDLREESSATGRYGEPARHSRSDDTAEGLASPVDPLAAVRAGSPGVRPTAPAPPGPGHAGTGAPTVAPAVSGPPLPDPAGPPGSPPGPQPVSGHPPVPGYPLVSSPPPVSGPHPAMPASTPREGVYRTRRPGLAILYLLGVVIGEWPAIRLFADGAFDDHVSGARTVTGMFLVVGLPLFGRGLFALQAGAGKVPDQQAGHGWLRPPLAYLTVGLVLLLAAGLAAA